MSDFPLTYFWDWPNNPGEILLGRRIDNPTFSALFYYRSESNYKEVIHSFKYDADIKLGRYFSQILAKKIKESSRYTNLDIIVPVPLYFLKKWKRGFNQSAIISKELSKVLEIPLDERVLKRVNYSKSQTVKDSKERKEVLKNTFKLNKFEGLENKKILLVDDVLTTGSTIEACVNELLKIKGVSVSIVTLGFVE